jgi:polyhydroxybutyrate depolymerase
MLRYRFLLLTGAVLTAFLLGRSTLSECSAAMPGGALTASSPGMAARLFAEPEAPAIGPGTHTFALMMNATHRSYTLHVPPSYDGKQAVPLVVVLHGRGSSGEEAERAFGMDEKADQEGFVVVYPDAVGSSRSPRSWNTGFELSAPVVDDSAFLRTLIQKLSVTLGVDRRKVFVAGYDNGGTMAGKLAAEFASRIAAVGIVGGAAGVKAKSGQAVTLPRPAHPVSVIAFHGKKDDVVPYGGDYYLSARASIAFWVRQNDCSEPVKKEVTEDGNVTRETYTGCDEEAEVTLYTIRDGDHRWPGARDTRPFAPPPSSKISATDLMWAFFARHHR